MKDASFDEDIRQAFKTEEVLLELDTKLEDFEATHIEASNYHLVANDKYEALDFLYVSQVIYITDKFKRKHQNIALV